MFFKRIFLSLILIAGLACQTISPTTLSMGKMVDLNNEVAHLYVDCSVGPNYVPSKEGCHPELLKTKVDELLVLSEEFISADIKQPQGYDIHLATAMIYFRIAEGTLDEYTKAEQIARQFFEVQKAHSGQSIDDARFYWTWFAAATASKQFFEAPQTLTNNRKAELHLAFQEGLILIDTRVHELEGPRRVRLFESLRLLESILGQQ